MFRYKGVIFDLDGVICHTDEYHYKAWKTIADELHIPFDHEVNNKLRGVSRMESLAIILKEGRVTLGESQKEHLAGKKNDLYRRLLMEMSEKDLDPVVMETLQTLKGYGVKMAIGSSSKNATFILEKLGLAGFFDAVVDGNCIHNSKPDPEVFEKARVKLGLEKKDCVVVEDAFSGIEAAINAGMDCIGIGDAGKSNDANFRIQEFSELLEV